MADSTPAADAPLPSEPEPTLPRSRIGPATAALGLGLLAMALVPTTRCLLLQPLQRFGSEAWRIRMLHLAADCGPAGIPNLLEGLADPITREEARELLHDYGESQSEELAQAFEEALAGPPGPIRAAVLEDCPLVVARRCERRMLEILAAADSLPEERSAACDHLGQLAAEADNATSSAYALCLGKSLARTRQIEVFRSELGLWREIRHGHGAPLLPDVARVLRSPALIELSGDVLTTSLQILLEAVSVTDAQAEAFCSLLRTTFIELGATRGVPLARLIEVIARLSRDHPCVPACVVELVSKGRGGRSPAWFVGLLSSVGVASSAEREAWQRALRDVERDRRTELTYFMALRLSDAPAAADRPLLLRALAIGDPPHTPGKLAIAGAVLELDRQGDAAVVTPDLIQATIDFSARERAELLARLADRFPKLTTIRLPVADRATSKAWLAAIIHGPGPALIDEPSILEAVRRGRADEAVGLPESRIALALTAARRAEVEVRPDPQSAGGLVPTLARLAPSLAAAVQTPSVETFHSLKAALTDEQAHEQANASETVTLRFLTAAILDRPDDLVLAGVSDVSAPELARLRVEVLATIWREAPARLAGALAFRALVGEAAADEATSKTTRALIASGALDDLLRSEATPWLGLGRYPTGAVATALHDARLAAMALLSDFECVRMLGWSATLDGGRALRCLKQVLVGHRVANFPRELYCPTLKVCERALVDGLEDKVRLALDNVRFEPHPNDIQARQALARLKILKTHRKHRR